MARDEAGGDALGRVVSVRRVSRKIEYVEAVENHLPFVLTSPNAIDPVQTFTAFLVSVLTGARRFAQTRLLRTDTALRRVIGIVRVPSDDTLRNFFRRFGQAQTYRFYSGLWAWQMGRLPRRTEGYSLDLDSTLFERYGRQEGARKGHNPRKHGRSSHHPLLAVLAQAHFILHGWLRSGDCGSGRGAWNSSKKPWRSCRSCCGWVWCGILRRE